MEAVKPKCYDFVPPCTCMDCQLYDVRSMVAAKSSIVSSRSPFLPRYAATLLSRPSVKSASCSVSSALSSRPSCSVAASTRGLADIVPPKPVSTCSFVDIVPPKPVCEPGSFPRCPYLSRPRLDFADLSTPCFSPGSGSAPAVSATGSVPVASVQSVAPIGCPAALSGFASTASVWSRPVMSPAVSRLVPPSPFRPVLASPSFYPAAPFGRPVASPFGPSPGFVPFLVPRFVPVLLSTVFGFVLSFLLVLC